MITLLSLLIFQFRVVCFQYLSDASDAQNWLNEKKLQLAKEDYGKDEEYANKLLTKHKVIEYIL